MNRQARDNRPNLRPVEKIELSEKNIKGRMILVFILIALAGCTLIYAINGLLTGNTGWTQIDASSSSQTNCSDEFVFQYEVGTDGANASTEKKALINLYSTATEKAYQLFQETANIEGVNNVAYINRHPNEKITIDPVLYQAFEKLDQYGNRNIYLGPVYEYYDSIFHCQDQSQIAEYDPQQNPDIKDSFEKIAAYARDEEMISLELLGDNQVILHLAPEYEAYCKEEDYHTYINFYWMKNAFIADYLADVMVEKGFTKGTISSVDGYTRNLDNRGNNQFSLNLYDRVATNIYSAGVMNYDGPASLVVYRDFPVNKSDANRYASLAGGRILTSHLSLENAQSKASLALFVCYSKDKTCADVMLSSQAVFIADQLDTEALKTLKDHDIDYVYGQDKILHYSDHTLSITDLYDRNGEKYQSKED